MYRLAARALQAAPQDIIFVDDRPHNLDAARAFGMRTVLFNPTPCAPAGAHPVARSPDELLALAESA
jgi:putative hydrolase of the HAD superfamily